MKATLLIFACALALSGCAKEPEWIEVEVVRLAPHDGTYHGTYNHTVVKDAQGRVYRMKGMTWGEPGTKMKVNKHANYFWN